MTATNTRPADQVAPITNDNGDHERFAHHVPADELADALIYGTPVTALCGKTWVPSRDPERFPVCPECKDMREAIDRLFGR